MSTDQEHRAKLITLITYLKPIARHSSYFSLLIT